MSSFSLLLRNPSVINNIIINNTLRKRRALTFRKTLYVYNYKVKPDHYYKNPHSIELNIKEDLKKTDDHQNWKKIKAMERMSTKPFGKLDSKRKFEMDHLRIPEYNIPDLTDFPLKPYVSYKVDKVEPDPQLLNIPRKLDRESLIKIKEQLIKSDHKEVRSLAREIFETDLGRRIVNLFLKQNEKNKFDLKIKNKRI
jgi:hypothetical protein